MDGCMDGVDMFHIDKCRNDHMRSLAIAGLLHDDK